MATQKPYASEGRPQCEHLCVLSARDRERLRQAFVALGKPAAVVLLRRATCELPKCIAAETVEFGSVESHVRIVGNCESLLDGCQRAFGITDSNQRLREPCI